MPAIYQENDELAALCTLSVSLAELVEVRGARGFSACEVRALAVQTAALLQQLLVDSRSSHGGVPVDHVTAASVRVTSTGHIRLGHRELCAVSLSLRPQDVQSVLQTLGGVLTTVVEQSATRGLSQRLRQLVTSLRSGTISLDNMRQEFGECECACSGGSGVRVCSCSQVLALMHDELLGIDTSTDVEQATTSTSGGDQQELEDQDSEEDEEDEALTTCLELTLNPAANMTSRHIPPSSTNPAALVVDDSPCVSHEGSFPEVCVRQDKQQLTRERHQHAINEPNQPANTADICDASVTAASNTAGVVMSPSACSEVLAGNCGSEKEPAGTGGAAGRGACGGDGVGDAFFSTLASHRQQLMLEKDMVRMMRGKRSGINMTTSTPNQSVLASQQQQQQPQQQQRRQRRPLNSAGVRRASALYGRRRCVADTSAASSTSAVSVGVRPSDDQRPFNGPEFVIRAREPPRRVDLSQRSGCTGVVTVVLLTGQKLELGCQMDQHTLADVTTAVFEEEPYRHASLVGYAVLTGGEFLFPPPSTRLSKALAALASGRLILYQRFKLYPAPHALSRVSGGLHLLYLQLRQNVLENSLDVSSNQVLRLSSLALLAEFGDRSALSADESAVAYFLPEHYLPEPLTSQPELLRQLTEWHMTAAATTSCGGGGAVSDSVERRFVRLAAECRGYGRHRCSVDSREKSYNTLMLSIDPSCLRVTRCDPCGRSTTRTLHWSTVAKIEYKRTRRLVISTVGAESLTFCGVKFKLRCLEYLLQQHLSAFREGVCSLGGGLSSLHSHAPTIAATATASTIPSSSTTTTTSTAAPILYCAKSSTAAAAVGGSHALSKSPRLTSYCVRSPLSALPTNVQSNLHHNRGKSPAPLDVDGWHAGGALAAAAAPTRSGPARRSNVTPSPGGGGGGGTGGGAGGVNWRSNSRLVIARDSSPPPTGIRMGTRIAVSTLQRQKLRSREVLPLNSAGGGGGCGGSTPFLAHCLHASGPQITDSVHAIAIEIPSASSCENLPLGVRPVEHYQCPPSAPPSVSTAPLQHEYRQVTLYRSGGGAGSLGVRVVRDPSVRGGQLRVEAVSCAVNCSAGSKTADGVNSTIATNSRLMPGDVITHIGDTALSALTYTAAVERLRLTPQPVRLTVLSSSTTPPQQQQQQQQQTVCGRQALPSFYGSGGVKRSSAHLLAEDNVDVDNTTQQTASATSATSYRSCNSGGSGSSTASSETGSCSKRSRLQAAVSELLLLRQLAAPSAQLVGGAANGGAAGGGAASNGGGRRALHAVTDLAAVMH